MDGVFISLGGNIGDVEKIFVDALKRISEFSDILAASSLYETEPWGLTGQPNFLNAVVSIDFDGSPKALLRILQNIELDLGRRRVVPWGQRKIDLDILLFKDVLLNSPELTIPHRYLALRDFFLVPLLEIHPNVVHPLNGISLREYERRLPKQLRTIIARREGNLWRNTITLLSKDR